MKTLSVDTSTINNLLKDDECEALTERLTATYDVYISALNILEIAKTTDPALRERLRALAKRLGRDIEPLDLPNQLVRLICRRFHERATTILWSIADERRTYWEAMSEPNSLGECERQEALEWAKNLETVTASANAKLRSDLDRDVFCGSTPRPRTPGELLRIYLKANWQLRYDIPSKVYKRETGCVLPLSQLDSLLGSRPSIWPLYLMAYAYSIYFGSVWAKELGPRNPAGIIDLLYAVYLPAVDVFVTHDIRHGGQYDALRLLNAFNSRPQRTHVLNWRYFRSTLARS